METKQYIITGYTGFIGSNLCDYLKEKDLAQVVQLNLRGDMPEFLPKSEVLIHLAGKAHDLKNTAHPDAYYEVNYEKTKLLFDLFLQSEVEDFFFFSSVKAVADSVSGILTEGVLPDPKTVHGLSKLKAENYILSQKIPEGKRVFIIRPCMTHGKGNKGNLNLLYNMVKKGFPYPLATFENKRSFLSIDNLIFLLLEMIRKKQVPSGVYNFSDDEAVSTNDLIRIMALALKKKIKLWHFSKSSILFLAKMGDYLHLPLNSERLQKMTESYTVSNQKVKTALGIEKLPLKAEEGLIKTMKSFEK